MGRALAVVGVDAVHAHAAILAVVAWAVVDVVLAVQTVETWRTGKKTTGEMRR